MPTGYVGSCTGTVDGCSPNVTCDVGYGYSASLTCNTNGGTFGLSGCSIVGMFYLFMVCPCIEKVVKWDE